MTQPLWLFGTHLTIVADHTISGGKYDLIEGHFPPNTQIPLRRHTRYAEQLYRTHLGSFSEVTDASAQSFHPDES